MNSYHADIAFNNQLHIGGTDWQVGNQLTPLDFATTTSGPKAWGAGVVPPAGVYATSLDVSPDPQNFQEPPQSLVPHVMTAAAIVALLMVRR